MNSDVVLQDALLTEFWLNEAGNLAPDNIFKEFIVHPEADVTSGKSIAVRLNYEDTKKIKELCDDSEVLIFNFYSTVLSILLNKYFGIQEINFISPYEQFGNSDSVTSFFLFKSLVNEQANFKELFSESKEFLVRSLGCSIGYNELSAKIGTAKLKCLQRFGLVINDDTCSCKDYLPELLYKVFEDAGGSRFKIEFSGVPLDMAILELFAHNFGKLLHEIVDHIYEPVKDLAFISELELGLLQGFNLVEPVFSLEKNITELIKEQADRDPFKTAIQHNDLFVNYATLEQRTNQLAVYLKEQYQLKKGSLVGVMMDRSIIMAECILGIWKAGGTYVPMDINFPESWLRQIIEETGLTVLLIDGSVNVEKLQGVALHVAIVNTDDINAAVSQLPGSPFETGIQPNDLAYVIYTSGSTGKPKGVMIEHLGMINHIGSKIVEMQIGSGSKVAQNAPHTFDISVWQYFAGLVAGGTTIVFDQLVILDPVDFVNKVSADQVTVLELVPSYLIEMLKVLEEAPRPIDLSHLKILILNAETLMPAMVKRWFALYPHIPIVNTYGATEASDDISHYIMQTCPDTATIPVLKRPIQNFEVHIVNEDLQLVPIGVKGEIILSGLAIGRGYLNDKERTERSFLRGPIPGITQHSRVYRTGDMGRYLADGTMEFLGRKDTQVKIRGHRIELGEIEHALMAVAAISHTAVIADQEQQYLVAYYQADQQMTKEFISNSIRARLPEYMLPHYYIQLEKMPLTPNGKIDKKALPNPDDLAIAEKKTYLAPRNEIETKLVLIWQEILGKEPIGVNENFFELGGHSIKAMKLFTRIHKEFNTRIKLEEIFRKPTVEEIAKDIARAIWAKKSKEESAADPASDKSFIL